MNEVCGDNRFEIIEVAKKDIIESTNIKSSPEEMKVLDNILFRCWQMGWLDKYGDVENVSDGYHTFKELYEYRKLYNAAFFNEIAKDSKYGVVKSKRHYNGEECFGGGWFIVMAELPTGQISNHYELKDWDLFKVPEVETAPKWDGHTPKDAAERLEEFLKL